MRLKKSNAMNNNNQRGGTLKFIIYFIKSRRGRNQIKIKINIRLSSPHRHTHRRWSECDSYYTRFCRYWNKKFCGLFSCYTRAASNIYMSHWFMCVIAQRQSVALFWSPFHVSLRLFFPLSTPFGVVLCQWGRFFSYYNSSSFSSMPYQPKDSRRVPKTKFMNIENNVACCTNGLC